jgi:hypothetical protein
MGILSLESTIYELCESHPELVGILKEMGFESIGNPIMMRTAARIMTLPKAAAMKGIDLDWVIKTLEQEGYIVQRGADDRE